MKIKNYINVILVLLLLGLTGWWAWMANRPAAKAVQKAKAPAVARAMSSSPAVRSVAALRLSTGAMSNAMIHYPSAAEIDALQNDPELTAPQKALLRFSPDKAARYVVMVDARNQMNSKIFTLYGKVVDQYGAPIAGVQLKGSILIAVSPISNENKEVDAVSDAAGKFQFTGLQGADFGVIPQKTGYEFNGKANWNSDYKPDPNNPMIFTMWKLQGAEPMVHESSNVKLPCDGTPTNINLSTGKTVTSAGDMIATFIRNPVQIHRGTPFEWTLTLEVPGGGLTEINDSYPYLAPEKGYQETTTLGTGPNPKSYMDSVRKNYYYKSADGKYGRITVDLQADFQPPPTLFGVTVYLNPSGSRNLEWDSAKEIKPAAK